MYKNIFDFYDNHSTKEVLSEFKLSAVELLSIVKSNEYSPSVRGGHKLMILTNMANKESSLLEISKKVSKEDLIDYYITTNHRFSDTAERFCITEDELLFLLNHYNCKKPKSISNGLSKETCEKKYGNSTYNNRDKAKQTCIDKYGVDNVSKIPEVCAIGYVTKCNNNGVNNPNNWRKGLETRIKNSGSLEESYRFCRDKARLTCLEKYGVPNAAMSEEIKDKIRDTLESTFMNKYGSTCYWTTPGAVHSNGSSNSNPNNKFAELLDYYGIVYEREFSIGRFIYDFKVGNILIEINPTATHNLKFNPFGENRITKTYHADKLKLAESNGFRCIHVWDWDDIYKVVEQLLLTKIRLYARKCVVKEVSLQEAKEFINKNHLQGYAKDSIRLGLYYEDVLVSVMTFGKPRYNKNYEYELIRYCSWCSVIGGAEKLFKYFISNYSPSSIISYCDRNKFEGNVYSKLGFKYKDTSLSTHWYHMGDGTHILDSLLRARGFDQLLGHKYGTYGKGTSNSELMYAHGFVDIIDAGQASYEYIV